MSFVIATFYHFVELSNYYDMKDEIKAACDNIELKGKYVDPEHWDDFTSQPDVLVIDTRNEYEVKLGKFKNAINPHTQCFRDFPEWAKSFSESKDLKVAMYCTGGIRCENLQHI
ncbi:UPF0176 protein WD_1135 [Trichonephila clavata]|uniref:UPF0176 protein WD_1135 n=1 Tax=Trichonephila clavata TaxID=2740835 RepID=A0A8X6HMX7_TRICU|nr:UPF0176 protein WD_1135 [Trichonephila clavata]